LEWAELRRMEYFGTFVWHQRQGLLMMLKDDIDIFLQLPARANLMQNMSSLAFEAHFVTRIHNEPTLILRRNIRPTARSSHMRAR
jgi:hypothetical protein